MSIFFCLEYILLIYKDGTMESYIVVTTKIKRTIGHHSKPHIFIWKYKTTEYLRMKSVLDSIELQMLRRAEYMRERDILRESHVHSYETQSVRVGSIEWGAGWADSLLSLAFATRWNPKHPSYVSIRLFCNSTSQLCCGEQTI